METLYKGLILLGQGVCLISAIAATLIGLYIIFRTIRDIHNKRKFSIKGEARIVGKNQVSFVYNNQVWTVPLDVPPIKENIIPIVFNTRDPTQIRIAPVSYTYDILLIFGVPLLIAFFWVFFWLTLKFKPLAAFEGLAIFIPGI